MVSAGNPLPRIAIFAPHPLLTVTLEREGARHEQVHFHPGGQGVWVARMAASLGAEPVLCGFLGGESGELLGGLLQRQIRSKTPRGHGVREWLQCDRRRSGELELLA